MTCKGCCTHICTSFENYCTVICANSETCCNPKLPTRFVTLILPTQNSYHLFIPWMIMWIISPRGGPYRYFSIIFIQLFVFEDQIREACSAALNPGYQGAQLILRNNWITNWLFPTSVFCFQHISTFRSVILNEPTPSKIHFFSKPYIFEKTNLERHSQKIIFD